MRGDKITATESSHSRENLECAIVYPDTTYHITFPCGNLKLLSFVCSIN